MTEVEYVYEKPLEIKKSHKKLIGILLLIVIIVLSASFLYTNINWKSVKNQTFTVGNQTFIIPSEYKGAEGLDYIRNSYSSELTQAKDICINRLEGNWIDNSTGIGCYGMQGFSEYYCSLDTIRNLTDLCNSIEGNSTCTSAQASCEL